MPRQLTIGNEFWEGNFLGGPVQAGHPGSTIFRQKSFKGVYNFILEFVMSEISLISKKLWRTLSLRPSTKYLIWFFLFIYFKVLVCVYICEYIHTCCCGCTKRPGEAIRSLEVIGICRTPNCWCWDLNSGHHD